MDANGHSHGATPSLSSTRPPSTADRSRPRVCATEAPNLIVGQRALREYHALCEAEHRRKELRRSIVELLEAGAAVESGPFGAYSRQYEQRRFSAEQLVRLLGQAEVERLRRLLQPTVDMHLIVKPVS